MTTVARFTPTPEYRAYRVTLDADRYDGDSGRLSVTVHAIGPLSARQLAEDQVCARLDPATGKPEYPCAVGLRAEVVS
jgi:hypothetical protein